MPTAGAIPVRAIDFECVVDARARVGEGAIWSVSEQALYWVDIPAGELHRFQPATGECRCWSLGSPVGCCALIEGGGAVVALASGFHRLDLQTGELHRLAGLEPQAAGNRFNDGTVDNQGRFLAGTMSLAGVPEQPTADGTLYRLGGDCRVESLLRGFTVVNGLAFSPDYRTLYVSESHPDLQCIWAHEHDPDSGALGKRRVFFDTRAVAGRPDGGAVDTDGCYWMAGIGGWHLLRITPAGRIDRDVPMPVARPTRIAFGGERLDILYVTSIGEGLTAAEREEQPQAGGVFALQLSGIQGCEIPMMTVDSRA